VLYINILIDKKSTVLTVDEHSHVDSMYVNTPGKLLNPRGMHIRTVSDVFKFIAGTNFHV
jgi:hypothetical protein